MKHEPHRFDLTGLDAKAKGALTVLSNELGRCVAVFVMYTRQKEILATGVVQRGTYSEDFIYNLGLLHQRSLE
jgi:hypothetical protein